MAAPANVTADRLDRVTVGQFVCFDPIVLTTPTPETGWVEVTSVEQTAGQVVLGLGDDTPFVGAPDRLVRIGW